MDRPARVVAREEQDMNDTGGPAFPHSYDVMPDKETHTYYGMTLRDWFATHAPEPPKSWRGGERGLDDIIEWRWWYADAMLKKRSKT